MDYLAKLFLSTVFVISGILLFLHFFKPRKKYPALKKGDVAPDFTLVDEEGNERSLHRLKGHRVVIYFFPKADTPGCTQQACGIRDAYDIYKEKDIKVFGISYDSPETLKKFKEKYHLPFTLLSDSSKEVAQRYGAYKSAINALFPARITFLVNEEGKIVKIIENVDVSTHAQDIISAFGLGPQ